MLVVSMAMVVLSLIGFSSAAGPAWPAGWATGANSGQTYSGYADWNATFNFEQSVQGTGYHMAYIYAKAGNVAVKKYQHGSGSLDDETLLTYQNWWKMDHQNYADYNDFAQNCIQLKEDVAMVYAPMRIAVGTGYYAANPLDYSSLIKEKTWVKNYRAGTMMHHEVEYAHALDKELNIDVKEKYNWTHDPVFEGIGYTRMTINEDMTDGKAHIGVLQANENYMGLNPWDNIDPIRTKSAWKDPAIEIDEDYWGTYHIEKNMTLEVPYYVKQTLDDWLPCCFGGFDSLKVGELRDLGLKSATGVFDCTCFKAPTTAEFPREY